MVFLLKVLGKIGQVYSSREKPVNVQDRRFTVAALY